MALTDMFYAILALDSYNRGPDPGIVGLGEAGSTIGSATILNVPVPPGSEAATSTPSPTRTSPAISSSPTAARMMSLAISPAGRVAEGTKLGRL